MKYLITENRLIDIIHKFLNERYGNLNPIRPEGTREGYYQFLDSDNNLVMDGILNREFLADYRIAEVMKDMFDLDNETLEQLFLKWVEKRYGMNFGHYVIWDELY